MGGLLRKSLFHMRLLHPGMQEDHTDPNSMLGSDFKLECRSLIFELINRELASRLSEKY